MYVCLFVLNMLTLTHMFQNQEAGGKDAIKG